MITNGSKWFFGLGFVTLVLAAAYGWTTGGNGLGPLTVGYKGAVGDHFGYGILVSAAVLSVLLGFVATAVRDAEAESVAQVAGTDTVPAVTPAGTSYWPAASGFGVALVVIGLVSSTVLMVFGLIVLGIVLVEWTVQAWADRATGDPETNRRIRNRVMNPIEFPAAAALVLGVVAIAFSRVFLSFSAETTVWIGIGFTALIVAGAFLVASRPSISSNVVAGVVVVVAAAIVAIGVAGAVAGPREFHHEEEEAPAEEGALGLPAPSAAPAAEVAR
ncbi:MAG TPA: hypothetical protein VFM27_08600 [Acidimicrobiales bacterium]|nr:hypothetical protein [Acidimicrobiales bacterium]